MMREIIADVISATVFFVTWNMIDDTESYLEEMHYEMRRSYYCKFPVSE